MATEKQEKALENMVENGGNTSQAMKDAGYSPNTAKTPQKLTGSRGFIELCEERGLTNELLLNALVEDIKSKPGKRKEELMLGFKIKGLLIHKTDITAEEKFKKQNNGNVHHYIYYRCTHRINATCTEKAVQLKNLEEHIDGILSGLTISEKFQNWALKYLHEARKGEAQKREQAIVSKHKEYEKVTKQIDNLVLQYIDPSNKDGRVLLEEEYVPLRSTLLKRKAELASELKTKDQETNDWVELSERTFNFARYAQTWFAQGDLDTKRAIFLSLGSDLLLKDQKVSFNARKPFNFIFEGLSNAEEELSRLEPLESVEIAKRIDTFSQQFSVLSG